MFKHLLPLTLILTAAGFTHSVCAQENLLAGKTIATLGEAKTWTSQTGETYTFETESLAKLVAVPTNTDNVFLFPEAQNGGGYANEANQTIGIQGFFIDMEATTEVGTVSTTWEGASANSFNIYLSDNEPTLDILNDSPVYSATGLGQYQSNTAVLPAGSKGRYLVFQPTDATNWGWGVKIRSISAEAPVEEVFTTFSVTPGLVKIGEETTVALTFKNQFGADIAAGDVIVSVSDNATINGDRLIANSGSEVIFSATYKGVTLTATVYIISVAPTAPDASDIKTPIFTNTITDYNGSAVYETAWNGGSVNLGLITFENGEVAQAFGNTRCVFFENTATLAGILDHFNPSELGLRSLHLDIFGTKNATGNVVLEAAAGTDERHPFTLEAGKWTAVDIDLLNVTNINNMSIRFDESNMCDILLANIYFTPMYVEGDETAPVLSEITVSEIGMTSVILSFSATDDKSSTIYYSISDGTKTYSTSAASGETVNYTVPSLSPSTTYDFTVTASDGKNISEAKSAEARTTGFPAAPAPMHSQSNVVAVFSQAYGAGNLPDFDSWGSAATASGITTEDNSTVLLISNYAGQWGGLINLDINVDNMKYLHIDIYGDTADGTLSIAPVWKDAGDTPNKTIDIQADRWNSFDIELTEFGYPTYGNNVIQIALTNSTLSSAAIANVYFWTEDTVTGSIIGNIGNADNAPVDVYSIQGVLLRSNVSSDEATTGLPAGLYIIGNRKILVR